MQRRKGKKEKKERIGSASNIAAILVVILYPTTLLYHPSRTISPFASATAD